MYSYQGAVNKQTKDNAIVKDLVSSIILVSADSSEGGRGNKEKGGMLGRDNISYYRPPRALPTPYRLPHLCEEERDI